jgi:hypothetical protein
MSDENDGNGLSLISRRSLRHVAARLIVWGTIVLAVCATDMARGEVSQLVALPQGLPPPGSKAKLSGLQVQVQYNGVDGNGYAPLKVTVRTFVPMPAAPLMATSPPSPVERRLHLRISYSSQHNYGTVMGTMATECDVVLPAGATEASTDVLMPMSGAILYVGIQTSEGNRTIPELSNSMIYVGFSNNTESEGEPRYLFIDSDCPSYNDRTQITLVVGSNTIKDEYEKRQLLPMVPLAVAPATNRTNTVNFNGQQQPLNRYPSNDAEVLVEVFKLANVTMTPPDALQGSWLAFSRYDYIYIPKDELQTLKQQQPDTFASIRSWVRTGGRLVVYDINFADDLGSLETWLDLHPVAKQAVHSQPRAGLSRAWEFGCEPDVRHPDLQAKDMEPLVRLAELREDVRKSLMSSSKEERQKGFDLALRLAQPISTVVPKSDTPSVAPGSEAATPGTLPLVDVPVAGSQPGNMPGAGRIWLHPLGFGQIVAVAHPNIDRSFEGTGNALRRLTGKCDFVTKNGVSLQNRNKNFWNMLIPGVGQQPVYAFMTMITMFVFAIGPLNYFGLLRAKRLSLLLFTVPLGAGILTLGLFLYAATADGFGVKTRIRSLTLIDQRSGEAVSAARHSYYAGLAPANGLMFDDQTAIYPIDYEPLTDGSRREVLWGEGGVQNLRRGWLPSRALKQVFVVRPTTTEAKIDISENGSQLIAENQLGATLQFAVVTNSAGEMRIARNVKPGEKLQLEPIILRDLRPILSTFVEDNRAKFPDNYDPDQQESMWFSRSRRNTYYYPWRNNIPVDAATNSSLMEQGIQDITLRSSGLARMAPRTYLAIIDKGPIAENEKPLVPLGTSNPKELGSFHMVYGTW